MTNVTVELHYGGVWNQVPAYTRDQVVVTTGSTSESGDTPPSSASFTIGNRSLNYNPAYPGSLLFGKAGRYTPCRITIDGEVYELEAAKWVPGRSVEPVSGTSGDAWVAVTASGIRRRLGQGRDPLKSSHYRNLASVAAAYWPLDEGPGTLEWTDIIGGRLIVPTTFSNGQITSGQADLAPWLEKGLHLDFGALLSTRNMTPVAPSGGQMSFTWVTRRVDTATSWEVLFTDTTGLMTVASVSVIGSLNEVDVNLIGTSAAASIKPEVNVDAPLGWHLLLQDSGADLLWALYLLGNSTALLSGTVVGKNTTSVGYVSLDGGVNISHVAIMQGLPAIADPYAGYPGEAPGTRFARLCNEEGITHTTLSAVDASVPMGRQYPGTILEQFAEIERTDNALIVDSQTGRGVTFYPGPYRYNRPAALTIDFNAFELAPPTLPVLDDLDVRNDITVQRRDGAYVNVTQDTGPNNTQDPTFDPQGIGRVTDRPTVNCESDDQLTNVANWLLHVRTFDGMRCPTVTVDYVATPGLAIAAIGERISITNLPADLGPPILDLLVIGRTDTATAGTRQITYTTIPFDPYRVLQIEDGDDNNSRIPAGATTTNEVLDTTETGVDIISTTVRWIDSTNYASQFPFDIIIDGEQMTVTAISGTSLTQTMTVARSVNGVVKAHTTGATVQLFRPPVIAL